MKLIFDKRLTYREEFVFENFNNLHYMFCMTVQVVNHSLTEYKQKTFFQFLRMKLSFGEHVY